MNKFLYVLLLGFSFFLNANAQMDRCGTMKAMQDDISANHDLEFQYQKAAKMAKMIEKNMKKNPQRGINDTIIIPVVVHIIYKTPSQNIADERVYEQIEILNKDFSRNNADTNNTYIGLRPFASGVNIKFCLASFDPQGNPTTGIIRKATTKTSFTGDNTMKFSSSGGDNAWDAGQYLNLWTVNFGSTGLLGYAQFPGGAANTDGVVISFSSFGYGTAAPYNKGRTATHEVGHWLGLRHIWADDTSPVEACSIGFSGCGGSDGVDDTPNQCSASRGVQLGLRTDKCTPNAPGIMYMNYMDYSSDEGMNMFSKGQADRMLGVLYSSRSSLRFSGGCNGITSSEVKDAKIWKFVKPSGLYYCEQLPSPIVVVSNTGNKNIYSLELTYGFEDGQPYTFLYEEGIAKNEIANIELPTLDASLGQNDLYCYISMINEEPDTIETGFKVVTTTNIKPTDFESVDFFNDGFEAEAFPSNIYELNSSNNEFIWKRSSYAKKTGVYSLYFDFYDYPTEGAIDDFTLPPLNLSNKTNAKFVFDKAYAQFEDAANGVISDTLEIWVKNGCDSVPKRVYKKYGITLRTTSNTDLFFVPSAAQFKTDSIDLANFKGENVYITFRAINKFGNNLYLDNLNLKYDVATGIGMNNINTSDYQIFPNPTKGNYFVYFNSDKSQEVLISVRDITGKLLMEKTVSVEAGNNNIEMPAKQLPTGNVFITLTNGTQTGTRKLMVF